MTRTMYDSVTPENLPTGGQLYAGYADGQYANVAQIKARFPGVRVVAVTVNPADDEGDVLDVENGDATPADAPGWVERRRAAGAIPSVYCSTSTWPTVIAEFSDAKVDAPNYWVAAYPGIGATIPAGAVAHQYQDVGPFDISVVADHWPGIDPAPNPTPPPAPIPPSPRGTAMLHTISIPLDGFGDGWIETTIPWANFMAATLQGSDPATDGGYRRGSVLVQDRSNNVLVSVVASTQSPATVFVLATA